MNGSTLVNENQLVSDLQSGLEIGEESITGTLNYVEDGESVSNYMALEFSDLDEEATSVTAGLDPDYGIDPIELVGMENPSGVFKVTDTDQVFKVVSTDGENRTTTQEFSLEDIILVEPDS